MGVTDPDPLQLGSTGHVTASGTLDKDLTDAEYNIVVKVLGVKVVDNTHSMCSDNSFDIKVAGVKVGHVDVTALDCPLAAGALRVDMDLSLTGVVPAGVGGATISLTAQDADAEELACMEMDAKIVKDAAVTDTCSLYEIGDGQCGQSDLDCAYVKYAKAAEKDLKDGTCVDQGYTHVTGTTTRTYPIIGDIVITMYDQEGLAVADTCSLSEIGDGQCGQSDLDCAYVKYAKAAEKDLKDGTCVDQGYTHVTGTTTRTYPIIGDI